MPDLRAAKPPRLSLLALEQRALVELGAFAASSPILRLLGRGDHHPVLVLPGFTASDNSTLPLRWVLRSQGYWVHGWRLGRNLGPTPEIVGGIVERLTSVHSRHGRKVSLIGWSLGGVYARYLARALPHMVRQVITLGSPFRATPTDRSNASRLYEALRGQHVEPPPEAFIPEHERPALTVPSTAIYTRTDGVVAWHVCIDEAGDLRENIEVIGSHSGLGHNPAVIIAVADRLALPEGEWRPFRPPFGTNRMYPKPVAWEPHYREAAIS